MNENDAYECDMGDSDGKRCGDLVEFPEYEEFMVALLGRDKGTWSQVNEIANSSGISSISVSDLISVTWLNFFDGSDNDVVVIFFDDDAPCCRSFIYDRAGLISKGKLPGSFMPVPHR
jgi:hypothetical protein